MNATGPAPSNAKKRHPIARAVAWAIAVLLAYLAVTTLAPDSLMPKIARDGASTSTPYAQTIALPILLGIAFSIVGIPLVISGLWRRRAGRSSRVAVVGLVLTLVGGTHIYGAVGDGISAPTRMRSSADTSALTVFELNVAGDAKPVARVLQTAEESKPDVVVLLEAHADYGRILAKKLSQSTDRAYEVAANAAADPAAQEGKTVPTKPAGTKPEPGPVNGVVVVYSPESTGLRPVSFADVAGKTAKPPSLGAVSLVDEQGRPLIAVHAHPPLRADIQRWQGDIRAVAALCDVPDAIIVGDLNATFAHGPIRESGCRDAAEQLGHGAMGTWPVAAPAWLGSPIDHVLAGEEDVTFSAMALVDIPRTDHRALLVRLTR